MTVFEDFVYISRKKCYMFSYFFTLLSPKRSEQKIFKISQLLYGQRGY